MFNKKTDKYIEDAVKCEREIANEFGKQYNSLHEAYSVLHEEIEEAHECNRKLFFQLKIFWAFIRGKKITLPEFEIHKHVSIMKHTAENLAKEACQIAAVCDKFLDGPKD